MKPLQPAADEVRAMFPGHSFGAPHTEADIRRAEAALGAPLPVVLRELYLAFDGFHGYDLDFSFRAHLAGFRVGVATDLLFLHQSRGKFDAAWEHYGERLMEKHAEHLLVDSPSRKTDWPTLKWMTYTSTRALTGAALGGVAVAVEAAALGRIGEIVAGTAAAALTAEALDIGFASLTRAGSRFSSCSLCRRVSSIH